MRFIVTGGCGFIGAAVVRALVERGDRVLNIDRRPRTSKIPALASVVGREGYARLEADIADRALMRAVFGEFQPQRVIHLAAPATDDPQNQFDTDLSGGFSVLEACRHHVSRLTGADRDAFRLVHAVRSAAPADEDTLSLTPREATAAAGALLFDAWSRAHGLPLVTCHAGDLFGPFQSDAALLPCLVASLLADQAFPLQSGGETVRDWLPAKDFAAGLILAATHAAPFTRYEFSAGAERSDADIAAAICTLMDTRFPHPEGSAWANFIDLEGSPPASFSGPMLDPADAERDLGWTPASFHEGLDRMVAWALGRYLPAAKAAVAA